MTPQHLKMLVLIEMVEEEDICEVDDDAISESMDTKS